MDRTPEGRLRRTTARWSAIIRAHGADRDGHRDASPDRGAAGVVPSRQMDHPAPVRTASARERRTAGGRRCRGLALHSRPSMGRGRAAATANRTDGVVTRLARDGSRGRRGVHSGRTARRLGVEPRKKEQRSESRRQHAPDHFLVDGVIGNTADFGSVILGSSPSRPDSAVVANDGSKAWRGGSIGSPVASRIRALRAAWRATRPTRATGGRRDGRRSSSRRARARACVLTFPRWSSRWEAARWCAPWWTRAARRAWAGSW